MGRRLLPVALVLSALAADGRDHRQLAFYVLVAAVPAAAVSALSSFGDLAELPGRTPGVSAVRLDALLGALALVCVLVAVAARSHDATPATIPPLSTSAVTACLGVLGFQALALLVAAGVPAGRLARE